MSTSHNNQPEKVDEQKLVQKYSRGVLNQTHYVWSLLDSDNSDENPLKSGLIVNEFAPIVKRKWPPVSRQVQQRKWPLAIIPTEYSRVERASFRE